MRDLGLAAGGVERIDAAARRLPTLHEIGERLARERPLAGYRLAACLDVTAPGAVLVRTLAAAGADVVVCAAGSGGTEDDVAAALVVESELPVLAVAGEEPERFYAHLDAVCDHRPQLVIDEGGDLTGTLHAARREQLGHVLAAVEGTGVGVLRAATLAADGVLAFPVIDLADAETVRLVERRQETAQASLDRIVHAAETSLAGARVVVIGYGSRGRPLATRARELGARTTVTEVNPVRALEAVLDGFEVRPLPEVLPGSDVVVVAVARRRVLSRGQLTSLRDGAVLALLDGRGLAVELAGSPATDGPGPVPDGVEAVAFEDGRTIRIVRGDPAAPGDSAGLDDVKLATCALAIEHLATAGSELDRCVYPVPPAVDAAAAAARLAAARVELDLPGDRP